MKLYFTILICLLTSVGVLKGQSLDLLFFKGKNLPVKGTIITHESGELGTSGKIYFAREDGQKPKNYKLDKISAILTKDHKLYVNPASSNNFRSFAALETGVIFLSNGNSIAINTWEVAGLAGEIQYVNAITGESGKLRPDQFIAIYTRQPDLQLFGDVDMALTRLKTAVLPEMPKPALEPEPEPVQELLTTAEEPEVVVKEEFTATEVSSGATSSQNSDRVTGPSMPVDMDEFNEKAKQKVEKFASYVKTILEGEDRLRIRSVIDQALILFISDTCYIEVSSLNREHPISYNIRRYFNRLNYLADKYTKIEVTDGKVVKVSDIRKYKDTWYGTVTYGQRFSGYKDGMLVYTDYTQKNINIVLKVYEPEIDGESKAIWDVLLSNISVTETSQ